MNIIPRIRELHPEMTAWRHDLHAHPQTAFEETYAAELIARQLNQAGVAIHQGMAKTGVVGTIEGSAPATGSLRSIGLRADIDALDVEELNEFEHKSQNPGKMHACGHDGHTSMLLGAATYLAETRNFAGTVYVIFQPAEENEGGGRVMVEEGLFERFPMNAVFGMHNWPGMPVGQMGVREGPTMAAFDVFELVIQGSGSHAALPHLSIDPVVAAAQVVTALQSIVSRNVDPFDQVVITLTQIHGGDTWNVIPDQVMLRGTVRTFCDNVQKKVKRRIEQVVKGVTEAMGAEAQLRYERRYPATINTEQETGWSERVAVDVVGSDNVDRECPPSMGSEDFSFMLQETPGCYVRVGNGSADNGRILHNARYEFNDEALPFGATYWARLAEMLLPVGNQNET